MDMVQTIKTEITLTEDELKALLAETLNAKYGTNFVGKNIAFDIDDGIDYYSRDNRSYNQAPRIRKVTAISTKIG